MDDSGRVVKVSIFGHEYPIRAKVEDEGYVREVARYVDEKMREIEDTMKPSSTLKVAILTALNIADELMALRLEGDRRVSRAQERIDGMVSTLTEALGD
jgi:cell division protein ZapA